MRERRAFTLLELLVVVAIIAVLIALLVPSLVASRRQSKLVVCGTNLRQLAVGWQGYLDSNKGHFLSGSNAQTQYGGKQGRASDPVKPAPRPLNRFVGLPPVIRSGAEVFSCPSDNGYSGLGQRPGGETDLDGASFFDYHGTSYLTNRFLIGPAEPAVSALDPFVTAVADTLLPRLRSLNRSQIRQESRLLLIGDGGWDDAWNVASGAVAEWHGRPRVHNLAFLDTHVETIEIRKGVYVSGKYTLIPFPDLLGLFTGRGKE